MRALAKALMVLAWAAALVTLVGVSKLDSTLMSAAGIAAATSALLAGLIRAVSTSSEPEMSIEEIQEWRAEGWERRYGVNGPYMRWCGAEQPERSDAAHRPVWPREIGAPE